MNNEKFQVRVIKARATKAIRYNPLTEDQIAVYKVSGCKKNYDVIIYNAEKEIIQIADEQLVIGSYLVRCQEISINKFQCRGNSHRSTVCYHAVAAFVKMSSEKNKQITFFEKGIDALNYRNLGGSLIKIHNRNGGYIWAVVSDKKQTKKISNLLAYGNRVID